MSDNIWFTSDTHLGHANIIRYCGRPYKSVGEMNYHMIQMWNEMIGPRDVVYHLGDVSFNPDKYVDKLNGKITLIYGNHDKPRFNKLYHEVRQTHEMEIGGFSCLLTHVPLIDDGFYKKGILPPLTLLNNYDFIICGHVHEKWKISGKNVNVGVDIWDMKPVHIDELADFLKNNYTK